MISIIDEALDCKLLQINRIQDNRGWFQVAFNIDELRSLPFQGVCQLNHSMTELAGTVRGLNYQEAPFEQAKVIRCIKGSLYSIGADLRKNSLTFGKWCGFELDAESGNLMYIPRGYAHGLVVYENGTELEYFTDNVYSKEHAKSVRYDDPDIGIDWTHEGKVKILEDVLSEKNRNAKWLKEIYSASSKLTQSM